MDFEIFCCCYYFSFKLKKRFLMLDVAKVIQDDVPAEETYNEGERPVPVSVVKVWEVWMVIVLTVLGCTSSFVARSSGSF